MVKHSGSISIEGEQYPQNVDLNDIIEHKIGTLALPEVVRDPYSRPSIFDSEIRMTTGVSNYTDGRIEFGTEYDVRRVWLGQEFELIYSYLARMKHYDFYVHQFAPQGGLNARIHFLQRDPDDPVHKHWQSRSFGGFLDNEQLYFSRKLNVDETRTLKYVVAAPELHTDKLQELIVVSAEEQAVIDANEAERIRSARELQRDLNALAENRRRAAAQAHNIFLD